MGRITRHEIRSGEKDHMRRMYLLKFEICPLISDPLVSDA
jgi:hypothetical protein